MTRITYDEEALAQFKEATAQTLWDDWVKRYERRFPAQAYLDYVLAEAAVANAAGD